MIKYASHYLLPFLIIISFSLGCVSKKKFTAKESELLKCREQAEWLSNEKNEALSRITDLESVQVSLSDEIENLRKNMGDALRQKEEELKAKEIKLNELQEIIQTLHQKVEKLRSTITKAMENFKSEDISVFIKDGKVYISLSEKLLFKSGSYKVDPMGVDALNKLALVLNQQPEINITIEGHTDNVGTDFSNWDLSVMRATSIIRILTDKNVTPNRIIAAGRGPFMPIADNESEEGRSRNRRTEIILSPNMQEFFDILNGKSE